MLIHGSSLPYPHPQRDFERERERKRNSLLSVRFKDTLQPYRSFSGRCDERNSVDEDKTKITEEKDSTRNIIAVEESSSSSSDSQESVKKVPEEEKESQSHEEESVGDTSPPPPPPQPEKERKKGNVKINPLKTKYKKMLVGWEKIEETFENFPYYLK